VGGFPLDAVENLVDNEFCHGLRRDHAVTMKVRRRGGKIKDGV
jgi:hypothetical protein